MPAPTMITSASAALADLHSLLAGAVVAAMQFTALVRASPTTFF